MNATVDNFKYKGMDDRIEILASCQVEGDELFADVGRSSLSSTKGIPYLLERIAAGFPSPAESYHEGMIDLNRHLIAHPAATFLVRVSGWSMRDAGISPGDELIVDKSLDAKNGDVVIAVIEGEFTVKRFKRTSRGEIILEAANPDYSPIIPGNREWMIWGVITYVLHRP